jgi:hypothetical protein
MELDNAARRNLELTENLRTGEKKGSLLWVLDKTRTPMGGRLLRAWTERPLLSAVAIRRRLSAVEVVGSVTVICTDKTGTLTENSLTVEGITGIDGSESTANEALLAAVLCNDATEEPAGIVGDPLDVALWRWAVASGMDVASVRAQHARTATVAFDARSRYMEVSCEGDGGVRRYVKGAPEAVLALTGPGATPAWLKRPIDEATGRGSRVLLLASGPEHGIVEATGLVTFADPPRAGVPEAPAALLLTAADDDDDELLRPASAARGRQSWFTQSMPVGQSSFALLHLGVTWQAQKAATSAIVATQRVRLIEQHPPLRWPRRRAPAPPPPSMWKRWPPWSLRTACPATPPSAPGSCAWA